MKVLFTCDLFPPDVHGGSEIIAYNYAKVLKEQGHEVTVICRGDPKQKYFDGIRTIRVPIKKWYTANFLLIPIILKHAKNADVIHNFTFDTSIASYITAKLLRKPCIMSIMGVYGDAWVEMKKSWIMGKIRQIAEKIQLKLGYDKIHFLSEYSKNLGIKLGAPEKKSIVIVPGVEYKRFKPSKKQDFVLFVGRLVKQKGLDYLIEAAKKLSEIKFLIVGDGAERKRLEKIAPPNVKFLGFIPHEQVDKIFSKALIFCLPSIGEGLGIVLLEAMSAGCAIVSTIPFDYSGFTIPMRNPQAIAEKINYLIKNKDLAMKMGKENRKKAKNYKWENILKLYQNL